MTPRRPTRALLLALLFLAAVVLRLYLATQETVANPDIMRYVDQAQGLARDPVTTLRTEVYHPLHAAAALLAHALIGPFFTDDRLAWLWSLRTVAILAGAVVTLQVVWLARLLGAPFWASLAAGAAWLVARRTAVFGSDGLSDMLAIALFSAAMLTGLHALRGIPRRSSPPLPPRFDLRWLLAGVLAGLSYLARPEGFVAVVILAASLVFLALARRAAARRPAWFARWKVFPRRPLAFSSAAASLLLLLVGAGLPALPYIAVTQRFTGKVKVLPPTPDPVPAAATGVPPMVVVPHIARELFETFFWPCAIVFGLAILLKPRLWGRPRLRVPVTLWTLVWTAVMAAVLLHPAKGYLDGRHTLPLTFLLFGLLGLALAAWERPMRAWMNFWRRRPAAWARLPAWMRWGGWPRAFAGCVIALMLIPGLIELAADDPRADRRNLIDAARWIRDNTAPNVVFADHQRLVGFYSGRPYGQWFGTPERPELHQLEDVRRQFAAAPTPPSGSQPNATRPGRTPLIAGLQYELGAGQAPARTIGPYHAIATFRSAARNNPGHDHLYVLYALPDDPVLLDGRPAPPLGSLPRPATQPSLAYP